MTKVEAYKQIFGDEKIHIEGIDWNGEADWKFIEDLEKIKQISMELAKNNMAKEYANERTQRCI